MTNWQKPLKIVSVLTLIWGVLQALYAVMMFVCASNPTFLSDAGTGFTEVLSVGIALAVSSAIEITTAVLGIRAANDKARIKPAYIFGWVCLIYNAFNQLYSICVSLSPMNIAAMIAALILPVLYLIYAGKIKQENN